MAHSIEEQRLDQSDNASFNHEKPSEVTEDESHFPTGTRLLVIIISILFAMFLVALVSILHQSPIKPNPNIPRIAPSSQLQYPESPTNSMPSTTSAGTPAHTY